MCAGIRILRLKYRRLILSLVIRNTRDLIHPDKFKLKILLIAPTGFGKTEFLGTVPDIGIAACETGDGSGALTIAQLGKDFVEPSTCAELDTIASGLVFKDKSAVGLDSLTSMVRKFIKDEALRLPHSGGNAPRRAKGVPDLGDYGVMAEIGRQLLQKALHLDKHIIVTALIKTQMPDAETGKGEYLIGPDLPGQLFLAAPAMFDLTLVGTTKDKIVDEGGKRVKVTERFWITATDGIRLAKSRIKGPGNTPLFAPAELYDIHTGAGTFPYFFKKVRAAYEQICASMEQTEISALEQAQA